jgi:hypothetical protein
MALILTGLRRGWANAGLAGVKMPGRRHRLGRVNSHHQIAQTLIRVSKLDSKSFGQFHRYSKGVNRKKHDATSRAGQDNE